MSYWVQLKKKGAYMITDSRDKVIGGLVSALQVHASHRDFHSAFMVLLALGRVRPLKEELDETEEEEWIKGEKVAIQLQLFSRKKLNNELEAEIKFCLEELDAVWFWRDHTPEDRLQALLQVDEIVQACKVVGRNDLIRSAMNKLEQIFLFNTEDQAEISDDLNALLKDHPRDGKWGELVGRIARAKESVALAKAVMGR
jgi:hypothetical protein